MSSQSKKTFGNDPLDPWAEHGPYFDSKEIKNSKTGGAVHRVGYLAQKESHNGKKVRTSFGAKVKIALRQFRDREDIHDIYHSLIVIICLLLAISLLVVFVILPKLTDQRREYDYDSYISEVESFLNDNDVESEEMISKREDYKNKIAERIAELDNTEERNKYIESLISLYESEDEVDYYIIADLIRMKLEYQDMNVDERAITLYNLIEVYQLIENEEELKKALDEFMELPDDNTRLFQGATITEMKKILLERYSDE